LQKPQQILFKDESRFEPEFVQTSKGEVMLFYTGDDVDKNLPETAQLYLWNGSSYQRKATVPFRQRFEALTKIDKATH
jgi:hypothetical protein